MTRQQFDTYVNSLLASGSNITAAELRTIMGYMADFAEEQGEHIVLSTTGNSGPATYNPETGALNIPQYETNAGTGLADHYMEVFEYAGSNTFTLARATPTKILRYDVINAEFTIYGYKSADSNLFGIQVMLNLPNGKTPAIGDLITIWYRGTGSSTEPPEEVTAPVLLTEAPSATNNYSSNTLRVENENYPADELILPYDKILDDASLLTTTDVSTNPANTLVSDTVFNGTMRRLKFANPFPISNNPVTISTFNAKIKGLNGLSAIDLVNQPVRNWVGSLMNGWSLVSFPSIPGMINTDNFWRVTNDTGDVWGNGGLLNMKLPAGVNGGIAQHFAYPVFAGMVAFRSTNSFNEGKGLTTSWGWPLGYFIDGFGRLTWVKGAGSAEVDDLPDAGIVKNATHGAWYRVWREDDILTIDETTDGSEWSTVFNLGSYPGDIYALCDTTGYKLAPLQYIQHQGLIAV